MDGESGESMEKRRRQMQEEKSEVETDARLVQSPVTSGQLFLGFMIETSTVSEFLTMPYKLMLRTCLQLSTASTWNNWLIIQEQSKVRTTDIAWSTRTMAV